MLVGSTSKVSGPPHFHQTHHVPQSNAGVLGKVITEGVVVGGKEGPAPNGGGEVLCDGVGNGIAVKSGGATACCEMWGGKGGE